MATTTATAASRSPKNSGFVGRSPRTARDAVVPHPPSSRIRKQRKGLYAKITTLKPGSSPSASPPKQTTLFHRVASHHLFQRVAQHIPAPQFGRYLLVGVWNTLFGYATYSGLTAILETRTSYGYVLASLLSGILNITVAFFGYKRFVFKTRGNYFTEWLRCLAVYGVGILVSAMALPFVVWMLQRSAGLTRSAPYVAGALLLVLQVIYNFFGLRRFSFRQNPQQ